MIEKYRNTTWINLKAGFIVNIIEQLKIWKDYFELYHCKIICFSKFVKHDTEVSIMMLEAFKGVSISGTPVHLKVSSTTESQSQR